MLRGLPVVFSVLVSQAALGQRVQFPSQVPSLAPAPGTGTAIPAPGTGTAVPMPGTGTAVPVPGPSVPVPAPGATLEGTIQPPPAGWDPYAPPGSTPPTLLPEDPYLQFDSPVTVATMQKLVQEVRVDYLWMPGNGAAEFGINDMELSTTFAFPMFYNAQTPLLVTPGFAMHCWNGPVSVGQQPADLPPQVYDGYLDAAWNPQVTPWLGGELSFRIGVYSDFSRVTHDSVRYMGTGMAVLSFTPSFQVKAGVMYLDRNRVKILPAGGLIWTPNPDVRFEILFPDPKLARRLSTIGNTEWWGYARGEYGGGAWTVKRAAIAAPAVANQIDSIDYNDLRFAFEVGLAFEREIRYRSSSPPVFRPNSTVFLRGGLAY